MMNIALLGPSGIGKGTHAAALCERFTLKHAAIGEIFREHLRKRTALGILARTYMVRGELVPDEVVDAILEEWTQTVAETDGMLFDGFPRTFGQEYFLDELLARLGRKLDAAIYIALPDDEIVRRLAGRLICRNCQTPYHRTLQKPEKQAGRCDRCGGELQPRPGDDSERVRARLQIFHRTTEPVLAHYAIAKKLLFISGEGTVADVQARLFAALDEVSVGMGRFLSRTDLAERLPKLSSAAPLPVCATLDVVLLGGPGSGKGTQAVRLCEKLRLPHISTGDLFRENLRSATELGKAAQAYMDRGELVPDDVTDAMVEERIGRDDAELGSVLDGFPRTLAQAEALAEIMSRSRRRLAAAIYLKVSDDVILERLTGRLVCSKCQSPYHKRSNPPKKAGICDRCGGELIQRSDDNPETVRSRLATFHRQTEPLADYYGRAGLLHEVSAVGDPASVEARCLAALRGLGTKSAITIDP